jgi:NADPH:quinone reductase
MKAIEQFGYGLAAECMRWVDVPIPTPGPGQVLVKAQFVGIRWGDIMGRTGDPFPRFGPPPFNKLVGAESAGVIEAVGANVTQFRPGDRVFAACAGGYAEYAVADEDKVTPVPDHVPLDRACCYPVNMRAAYFLVYPWGKIRTDETVLLHAAAGGVGTLVCQVLRRRLKTPRIIGIVGSEEKAAYALENGADYVINYKTQDYVEEVGRICGKRTFGIGVEFDKGGVDIALNSVRGPTVVTDPQCIRKRGRWILYGASAGRTPVDTIPFTYEGLNIMPFSNLAWTGQPEQEDAKAFIRDWMVTEELIQPEVYDFNDLIEVQDQMHQGRTVGKVVLAVH